uniref:Uncharacterized protein n=1 Tax=Nothobranchius kuhntae TaxID=321403 RepID=A0A1A8IXW9_NOTKU
MTLVNILVTHWLTNLSSGGGEYRFKLDLHQNLPEILAEDLPVMPVYFFVKRINEASAEGMKLEHHTKWKASWTGGAAARKAFVTSTWKPDLTVIVRQFKRLC